MEEQRFCGTCGSEVHPFAEICPKCGVRRFGAPKSSGRGEHRDVNRVTAGLLALFLGGIGIHKFYLGKPGQGIFYILFFWTVIPAVIGFVEALIYFSMSDDRFEEQYGA